MKNGIKFIASLRWHGPKNLQKIYRSVVIQCVIADQFNNPFSVSHAKHIIFQRIGISFVRSLVPQFMRTTYVSQVDKNVFFCTFHSSDSISFEHFLTSIRLVEAILYPAISCAHNNSIHFLSLHLAHMLQKLLAYSIWPNKISCSLRLTKAKGQ